MSALVSVLAQMAGLIVIGWLWQVTKPGNLEISHVRQVLTSLVYYICLPALIIVSISKTSFSLQNIYIPLTAYITILLNIFLGWLIFRKVVNAIQMGALLLALSFPNATYLGLPVLKSLMGEDGVQIAIQYDFLASLPLLLTIGIGIAQYYGYNTVAQPLGARLRQLIYTPALLAALFAVLLNILNIKPAFILNEILTALANIVIPVMMLVLGMNLNFKSFQKQYIVLLIVVVILQLFWMPFIAFLLMQWFKPDEMLRQGVILEAAMPTMLIGLIICEKYGLDTKFYAAALAMTTLLSFLTLPLWFYWLQI